MCDGGRLSKRTVRDSGSFLWQVNGSRFKPEMGAVFIASSAAYL
jgi:hypothetical protein